MAPTTPVGRTVASFFVVAAGRLSGQITPKAGPLCEPHQKPYHLKDKSESVGV
jgi:hypothetical protein